MVGICVESQDEERIRVMLAIFQTMASDVIADGGKPVSVVEMTTLFESKLQDSQKTSLMNLTCLTRGLKNGAENLCEVQGYLEKDMRFVADFLTKEREDENEDKKRLEGK